MSDKKKQDEPSFRKEKGSKDTAWYRDGLAFECTQCGACCSGDPGYVWVSDEEIVALADELGLERQAFESQYVREVGKSKSLIEYANGDCVLLDPVTRHCTAYAARPIQCRTWPFWDSSLDKRKSWEEACEVCPGAGQGRVYTFEQIEHARKQKSV